MEQLNDNELEVLRILWEESPQKPAVIQQEFGWEIDNGTLRSVLLGMVARDLVKRKRDGRAFYYSPRVRRDAQLKRIVGRIAEVFAGGSTSHLLMSLVDQEELSEEHLQQLRDIANGTK